MALEINNTNKKVPVYNLYLDSDTTLHISNGNGKMGKGVYNISLIPGNGYLKFKGTSGRFPKSKVLTNIKGTCGNTCIKCNCMKDCYAIKSLMRQHNTCTKAWGENTLLAREDRSKFFEEIERFLSLNLIPVFRWHVAGEIIDEDYFLNMIKVAAHNPDTHFYCYTKQYEIIEQNANRIPFNLHMLVSIWHKNYDNPFHLPEFIYNDGTEPELMSVTHCPAVNHDGKETGVTCAMCRKCWHACKGDKIAVYAH